MNLIVSLFNLLFFSELVSTYAIQPVHSFQQVDESYPDLAYPNPQIYKRSSPYNDLSHLFTRAPTGAVTASPTTKKITPVPSASKLPSIPSARSEVNHGAELANLVSRDRMPGSWVDDEPLVQPHGGEVESMIPPPATQPARAARPARENPEHSRAVPSSNCKSTVDKGTSTTFPEQPEGPSDPAAAGKPMPPGEPNKLRKQPTPNKPKRTKTPKEPKKLKKKRKTPPITSPNPPPPATQPAQPAKRKGPPVPPKPERFRLAKSDTAEEAAEKAAKFVLTGSNTAPPTSGGSPASAAADAKKYNPAQYLPEIYHPNPPDPGNQQIEGDAATDWKMAVMVRMLKDANVDMSKINLPALKLALQAGGVLFDALSNGTPTWSWEWLLLKAILKAMSEMFKVAANHVPKKDKIRRALAVRALAKRSIQSYDSATHPREKLVHGLKARHLVNSYLAARDTIWV